MAYRVELSATALRELRRIRDRRLADRLGVVLEALEQDPRPRGALKLSGQDSWRVRVGDLRVVYEIVDDMLLVRVVRIGHRSDVYRD